MRLAGAGDDRRLQSFTGFDTDVKMFGNASSRSTVAKEDGQKRKGASQAIEKRLGPSVLCVRYSPCGNFIVTSDQHGLCRVFHMLNVWQHELVLEYQQTHSVHHAVFSNTSPARYIATACTDGSARIYNFAESVAALERQKLESGQQEEDSTINAKLTIRNLTFAKGFQLPQAESMSCTCKIKRQSLHHPAHADEIKTPLANIHRGTGSITWDYVHTLHAVFEDDIIKFMVFDPRHASSIYKAEIGMKDVGKEHGFDGPVDLSGQGKGKVGVLYVSLRIIVGVTIDGPALEPQVLTHTGPVRSVNFSPDDRYIVTSCLDGAVHVYLKAEGGYEMVPIMQIEIDGPCYYAAFAPDSKHFGVSYSTEQESVLALYSVDEPHCIQKLGQECRITCAFECMQLPKEPEFQWICAGSDGGARIWTKKPKRDKGDVIAKNAIEDVHKYLKLNLDTEQELKGMEETLYSELVKKRQDMAKLARKLESLRIINLEDVDTKEQDLETWMIEGAEGLQTAKEMGTVQLPNGDKEATKALEVVSKEEILLLLKGIELFKRIPEEDDNSWEKLVGACCLLEYSDGKPLVIENKHADRCHVILEGCASIEIFDEVTNTIKAVGTMGKGSYVNESCLTRGFKTTSTIKADGLVKALMVRRDDFRELGLHRRLIPKKRHALHDGHEKDVHPKPPSIKSDKQRDYITKCLKANSLLLSVVETLDDTHCNRFIETCWEESVRANEDIISQGDYNMHFYILKHGLVRKYTEAETDIEARAVNHHDHQVHHESMEHVNHRSIGDPSSGEKATWFGETCLFAHVPSPHTVKAVEPSVLWVIDRSSFRDILSQTEESHLLAFASHLHKVPMFNHLAKAQRIEAARCVHEKIYRSGEFVYEQNSDAKFFYVLLDGEIAVLKDSREVMRKTGTHAEVEFFGGLEIDFKEKRQTSVKVTSMKAKILALDAAMYRRLLSTSNQPQITISANADACVKSGTTMIGRSRVSSISRASIMSNASRSHAVEGVDSGVKYSDLRRVANLGCGGFGSVTLVEHVAQDKDPRRITYALKTMSKGFIMQRGCKKAVLNEKSCHFKTKSVFIAKLYDTFNTHSHIHFLLEPALGGELQEVYVKERLYGSERHARYYIGSMVFALEHLKDLHIVYRDVKPENLMIHANGRMKLVDFGLAKVLLGRTFTICGTPEFMAPEMLKMAGYGYGIDWWALGILVHDLMTGHTPFEAPSAVAVFQKVSKGLPTEEMLHSSVAHHKICETLIRALCAEKPEKRLPMKKASTA